jgi:hypothetical protein
VAKYIIKATMICCKASLERNPGYKGVNKWSEGRTISLKALVNVSQPLTGTGDLIWGPLRFIMYKTGS